MFTKICIKSLDAVYVLEVVMPHIHAKKLKQTPCNMVCLKTICNIEYELIASYSFSRFLPPNK